jgi:PKD domain/NPCBM-associated, NEW3 domain of alpha-galactosidase
MNSVLAGRGPWSLAVMVSTAIASVLGMVLALATVAQANELVYWDNYGDEPATIAFANIDGSGGGLLNLSGNKVKYPEGMAFDSATGRLYIANSSGGPEEKGEITYVNVDGSGAGVLSTPGAEVNNPYGVAIDPASRTVYWANGEGGPEGKGSIAFARLDGSGGGLLNTAPVVVNQPYRVAIDPVSGRVFWDNSGNAQDELVYANLNNTGGGGTLALPVPINNMWGIAVDSAAGRVYWLYSREGEEKLLFANINGTPGGAVDLTGAVNDDGYGLVVDPGLGRIYWGNYGNGETRDPRAIGFVNLAGGGGAITPTSAPVDRAQDPVVLKSPAGTSAPQVTRSSPSTLACSTGGWAADLPGSFLYQAPRSYAYQWTLNGAAIPGATAATFTATTPGAYACTVTATNQAGSASQASATATAVKAAKAKLTVKPKVAKGKAGKTAKFKVKVLNQGDLQTKNAKVCVKAPKQARKVLKAKCKSIGKVGALKTKIAKVKVKVAPNAAEGAYKIKLLIKGASGKAAKATVKVIG